MFTDCRDLGISQNWGTFWGVPIIRIVVYWGLYWGILNLGITISARLIVQGQQLLFLGRSTLSF